MLKSLTPRHRNMIRKLVAGLSPEEVARDLEVTPSTVQRLLREDPLFKSELRNLEVQAEHHLIAAEDRITAMEVLEKASLDAAVLGANVIDGTEKRAPIDLCIKTAFDVLDRTGNKAPDKKIVGVYNAADVIIAAYKAKYKDKPQAVPQEVIDV